MFLWLGLSYPRVILRKSAIYTSQSCMREQLKDRSSRMSETALDNTSISISRAFCRAIADSSLITSFRREQCARRANWYVGINIVLSIEIFGPISFGRSVSVRWSTSVSLCDRLLRAVYPLGVSRAKRKAAVEAIRRPGGLALTRSACASLFHASSLWSYSIRIEIKS